MPFRAGREILQRLPDYSLQGGGKNDRSALEPHLIGMAVLRQLVTQTNVTSAEPHLTLTHLEASMPGRRVLLDATDKTRQPRKQTELQQSRYHNR